MVRAAVRAGAGEVTRSMDDLQAISRIAGHLRQSLFSGGGDRMLSEQACAVASVLMEDPLYAPDPGQLAVPATVDFQYRQHRIACFHLTMFDLFRSPDNLGNAKEQRDILLSELLSVDGILTNFYDRPWSTPIKLGSRLLWKSPFGQPIRTWDEAAYLNAVASAYRAVGGGQPLPRYQESFLTPLAHVFRWWDWDADEYQPFAELNRLAYQVVLSWRANGKFDVPANLPEGFTATSEATRVVLEAPENRHAKTRVRLIVGTPQDR